MLPCGGLVPFDQVKAACPALFRWRGLLRRPIMIFGPSPDPCQCGSAGTRRKFPSATRDNHSVLDKAFLLEQGARFRRLARDILDARAEQVLLGLAAEYEERAATIQDNETGPADGTAPPA